MAILTRRFAIAASLICMLAACNAAQPPHANDELVEAHVSRLKKGLGGSNGDSDYCNNPLQPCRAGEGDCDHNYQCQTGLICIPNIGARFGLGPSVDVCLSPTCTNRVWDADEWGMDCGGGCAPCAVTGSAKGTPTAAYGASDYCSNPHSVCVLGEGNCRTNAQCNAGLICVANKGTVFDLPSGDHACIGPTCTNRIKDTGAGETGVDCGGPCGPCVNASGGANFCSPTAKCPAGQGDCDTDIDCLGGTTCVPDVGANFGWAPSIDVCLVTHCSNLMQDADETGPDCGGNDCGVCQPTCSDGVQNGTEVGIDCGGACGSCACIPGATQSCYDGVSTTLNVGTCIAGTQVCDANGAGWGPCGGEIIPGYDDCSTIADEDCDGVAATCAGGTVTGAAHFGSSATQEGRAVATDSSGNTYIAGYFQDTVNFGGGDLSSVNGRDIFVASFDSTGAHRWSQSFGGAGDQFALGIAVDNGSVYVTGYFSNTLVWGGITLFADNNQQDIFLGQLDANNGNTLSAAQYGDATHSQQAFAVAAANGRVVVVGQMRGKLMGGPVNLDAVNDWHAFVLAFSADPTDIQSGAIFGDSGVSGQAFCRTVAMDPTRPDYLAMGGEFSGKIDFGGGNLSSSGGFDGYIASLKISGPAFTYLGAAAYGAAGDQRVRKLAYADDGILKAVGYFATSIDLGCGLLTATATDSFVASITSAFSCKWSAQLRGNGGQYADAVSVFPGGDVDVGGSFDTELHIGALTKASAGGRDGFIAHYRSDGTYESSLVFGDSTDQYTYGLAANAFSGATSVIGSVQGTSTLGAYTITSTGSFDVLTTQVDLWDNCRAHACTGFNYCDTTTGECKSGCTSDPQCTDPNEACDLGSHTCVCAANYHSCGGVCDSNSSISTCGASCTACVPPSNSAATCNGVSCGYSCNGGYHDCSGTCSLNTSTASCGALCTPCPARPNATVACNGVSCIYACIAGYHDCSGTCVANTSVNNCGRSSCSVCAAPSNATATCNGTSCGYTCNSGYHDCSGVCVANSSVNNCGTSSCSICTAPSHATATCDSTSCGYSCNSGYHDCAGVCVDNSSVSNCGTSSCSACSIPSNGTSTCNSTSCGITCNSGYHNCSGSCVDNSSVNNCGTSSCSACTIPSNGSSTCNSTSCGISCNSGYLSCSGSCGLCPTTGVATTTCSGTSCVPATCNAHYQLDTNQCVLYSQASYLKSTSSSNSQLFGNVVATSTSGTTVAVSTATTVFIFINTGGIWSQQATIPRAASALSLSATGDSLAIGVSSDTNCTGGINPLTMAGCASAGAAYVYTRVGNMWTQQVYIKPSVVNGAQLFGASIAIAPEGTALAVGAPGELSTTTGINSVPNGLGMGVGAAYVFRFAGGMWTQDAYIKPATANYNALAFGTSVALSALGNTLAVGATGEKSGSLVNQADTTAVGAGAVFVFSYAMSAWTQTAYVKASNNRAAAAFGKSVSLSVPGATLAVGANAETSGATGIGGNQALTATPSAGAVYVFQYSVSWVQQAYIKASNTSSNEKFGNSVSLSTNGNALLVGAPGDSSNATGVNGNDADTSASTAGAAFLFTRSGATWSQLDYFKASNTATTYTFGMCVALSGDGDTVVVGSPSEKSNSTGVGSTPNTLGTNVGAVYAFTNGASPHVLN